MMPDTSHVIIVGAGAGGLATAEGLRNESFTGAITLIGEEVHAPYDRPPLSKQLLSGAWEQARIMLRTPDALASLGATLRLGMRAQSVDTQARLLSLENGETLKYSHLVVATGVNPRALPGAACDGVFQMRTLDDALALQARLTAPRKVLVIGAGFLGTESAASLRSLGHDVTLAYPQSQPLEQPFGPALGRHIAALHASHGVTLKPNASATEIVSENDVAKGVAFADGSFEPADIVLLAIGSTPATTWLAGSNLDIENGIRCDSHGVAAPAVYAVGDVASWLHTRYGRHIRLEHRMNAAEQGLLVAKHITGKPEPFSSIPFVWSDQFKDKLQMYGLFPANATVEIEDLGTPERSKRLAHYYADGMLTGILGWNAPKETRQASARLNEVATA
ncbi:NAD(P)/FAD-dependent oxidoreductase [Bordetella sp. 2513F-2]